jgi:hypothetical protein
MFDTKTRIVCISATALLAPVVGVPTVASAHEEHAPLIEEIVTWGRAEPIIGVAMSASEGMVGYDDIRMPPLLRVGELAEAVPGMVATQHSGTGKANQYFLRGFNLDHGTDFSAHAEGVPLNMRTHGHGQGYLDLNFLIPELIETTHYQKGPYSPETGDFSSAGSVEFDFYDRLGDSLAEITAGEFGYYRGLLATTLDAGAGALTAALDVTAYDGPWRLDENLQQNKLYLGYVGRLGNAATKFTFQGYSSEWDATDQIPLRAVQNGLIDDLGFIDPDLGGSTDRYALTANFSYETWEATAYVVDYDFTLFSNFTYLLDDPVNGDQFEQRDDRRIYGLNVTGLIDRRLFDRAVTLRWGGELRNDDIGEVGLYRTASRVRFDTVRSDVVDELSLGIWGEAEWAITDRLRAAVGLRADYLDWDVDARLAENSGTGDDTQVSPKLRLAYRVSESLETYANYGRGMHSNDVRGATISIDPASGDPVDPVEGLVASDGAELGLRFEQGRLFNASVALFWLELDSELVFVGDAGGTEANSGSERNGVELNAFWQATDWLALNASYTYTDARFVGVPDGEDRIPGAIESTASLSANAAWQNGLFSSLRVRYLGEAPLAEDGSVTAPDSLLVNAGVAWRRGSTEWRLDVFNLFDSDDYDIAYFYPSRLPGEPADGVEDIHFHVLEPRSARASFIYYF